MSNWSNSKPTAEGWYFWKRNRNWQPWLWQAIYITNDGDGRGITYWADGTAVNEPGGGWWKEIDHERLNAGAGDDS